MKTVKLTAEQVAGVVGKMKIEKTTDLGSVVVHRGTHPAHGEVVAISSAVGVNLVLSRPSTEKDGRVTTADVRAALAKRGERFALPTKKRGGR